MICLWLSQLFALEQAQRRPPRRNMCRNQKRRSLGIDGGHLGCRVSRLANSFAEVAVLVCQLRWPAGERAKRGRNLSGPSLQQIINYTDTFLSPRKCECQTICSGGGEEKKKKWGCLGSWKTQQQLYHLVCGETKRTALVQIITLAG